MDLAKNHIKYYLIKIVHFGALKLLLAQDEKSKH